MTARQMVYLNLAKQGYSVEEIASITHRTTNTVRETLRMAVEKSCKSPENCADCLIKADCDALPYTPLRHSKPRERRGRYSY